jgi:hypothetical protein
MTDRVSITAGAGRTGGSSEDVGVMSTQTHIAQIAVMEKPNLIEAIRGLDCPFPIDLTVEYLDRLSPDELRHLLLALHMHARNEAL